MLEMPRYTEYDEYEEASEAAEAIEEAFQVAEEAAQTSDLADRYLALSQAEEIASEHSLMHLLPDHRDLAEYRRLRSAEWPDQTAFSEAAPTGLSFRRWLHKPASQFAPAVRSGHLMGAPCAFKLINLRKQPLSAAQLWHEVFMLQGPLRALQGVAVPKLIGYGIIKGRSTAFMASELLGPSLDKIPPSALYTQRHGSWKL
ncbi:hypothetical protein WJX84_001718 [Apatococcus fuscideae]|uniref:Uncharacterized protein n=1 Tax=Apatococcus fuscideae TaxID=2026836 RepID=A0AAW1SV22_9CHLO